jgi:glycogenin glucosyltransferase
LSAGGLWSVKLLYMAASFAICTLLTNDAYLPGAIALAAALRDLHPKPAQAPEVDFQSVCIVTPETVDVSSIKLLRRTFDLVVGVEILEQDDDSNLRLLGE